MAMAVPVPQAAAIMLPLLAVMDFLGIRALWRERDRELLKLLLPAGLLGRDRKSTRLNSSHRH